MNKCDSIKVRFLFPFLFEVIVLDHTDHMTLKTNLWIKESCPTQVGVNNSRPNYKGPNKLKTDTYHIQPKLRENP